MAASGKSTGTKKKTQSTSRAKQGITGKNSKKQVNSTVSLEVVLLLIFCVALVLFLCMVGVIKGAFGPAVKKFMLGIFGLIAYILPILIFVGICFHMTNKGNQVAAFKLAAGIVFLFMTGILICYISGMKLEDIAGGGHIFKDLYEYQGGGGVIFGAIACLFQHILGKAGTIILSILFLIISLVVLTEKSLLAVIKNGGKQIARSVKNGKELLAEELQNRYEDDFEEDEYEDSEEDAKENTKDDRRNTATDKRRRLEEEKLKKRERSQQEKERQQQLRKEEENERRKQKEQLDDERILSKNSPKEKKINFDLTSASALEGHLKKDELHEITLLVPEDEIPQELSKEYAVPEMNGYNHFSSNQLTEITYSELEEEDKANCFAAETEMKHSTKTEPDYNYFNNIRIQKLNPETPSPEPASGRDSYLIGEGNSQNEEFEYSLHAKPEPAAQKETIRQDMGLIEEDGPDKENKNAAFETKTLSEHQKETGSNISVYQAKSGKEETFADLSAMPEPVTERTHRQNGAAIAPQPVPKPKLFTKKKYEMPPINLLRPKDKKSHGDSDQHLKETALRLQQTLKTFGVAVTVTDISQGPSVTRYELQLGEGIKVNKIVNLADDIKLNLAAQDIRIEAPIPGKAAVGIEIPNKETSEVLIRELLDSAEFKNSASKMTFAVGKDITGKTIVADIAKMPHMLIAGATGSGKSVCINTLIMSILYKANPEEVKLIMIDPKVVELSVYNGIPHLMIPVVTDPKKASAALQWAVNEMTKRYKLFAELGVRDLKGYNAKIAPDVNPNDPEAPKVLPQIIVIVDELADLMMVASKEVEEAICRLAQLARAAGIHLIIATQRPSVDVITGLIKANMPSRVAFKVTSGVDSRTILDMIGAEKLLGKGDMLFFPQGYSKPLRVQGAFVSDGEVEKVVDFLKQNAGDDVYDQEVEKQISGMHQNPAGGSEPSSEGAANSGYDDYFVEACRFVVEKEKASSGMLQRVFKIGFNRAGRIVDQMEEAGVVGPEEGTKPRKVLMTKNELELFLQENGYV